MSKYIVDSSLMTGIADNIRLKTGEEGNLVFPTGFNVAIESLPSIEDMRNIKDKVDDIKDIFDSNESEIDKTITTPVDIASFNDGADGLPMALKVAVEPVQDLHGYDHPWPAGGGKNLARSVIPGTDTQYQDWLYIDAELEKDTTYTLSFNGTSGNKYYTNEHIVATQSFVTLTSDRMVITFTTNSTLDKSSNSQYKPGYGWIILKNTVTQPNTGIATNVQLEAGSSATSFAPYSNICPISGWTGAEVTRTGKNILKPTGFVQGALPWNGNNADTIGSSNKIITSEYICVKGLNTVTVKAWKGNIVRWYEVDKDKRVLSYLMNAPFEGDSYTFQLYEGCEYIRLSIGFDSTNVAPSGYGTDVYAQIEAGSTATAYEPYKGEQYQITFPAGAGTVYGGTLTVNKDGTGSLVVDYLHHQLNSTNYMTARTNGVNYNIGVSVKNSSISMGYCSHYNRDPSHNTADSLSDFEFLTANQTAYFIDSIHADTVDNFKAYINNQISAGAPIVIVAELQTPVTYPLTAPQVKTLLGLNNVWADTGKINEVEYSADSQLCITNKLNELDSLLSTYTGTQA